MYKEFIHLVEGITTIPIHSINPSLYYSSEHQTVAFTGIADRGILPLE